MERTHEMLQMGEKNSRNWKQLWEDGNKLEPRILGRTSKDLEEKLFFGLQVLRMMMRTTMTIDETLCNNEEYKCWTNDENVLKAVLEKEYDRW